MAGPGAVNPYVDYSQAVLSGATRLQAKVNETYKAEDKKLSWDFLGSVVKMTVLMPAVSEGAEPVKASYSYANSPVFRSGDTYRHIFFRQVIYRNILIFSVDEKVESDLLNLFKTALDKDKTMYLSYRYTGKNRGVIDVVAVLQVPYKPAPGANSMTAGELSELLTNFITAGKQAAEKIKGILNSSDQLNQVPLETQPPKDGQRPILFNFSDMAYDNFPKLAKLAKERLARFPQIAESLQRQNDARFPTDYKLSSFSTSNLDSIYLRLTPAFFVTAKSLEKISLVYGYNLPIPGLLYIYPGQQGLSIYDMQIGGAEQVLPEKWKKSYKNILSTLSTDGFMYAAPIKATHVFQKGEDVELLTKLRNFRPSAYSASGTNVL